MSWSRLKVKHHLNSDFLYLNFSKHSLSFCLYSPTFFYHRPPPPRPRIIWKTIYTVSDKWRSHQSAFKVNLSSGPWTPRPELSGSALSASVLTFWMSCQQSTANCVRDYTLRAAAQRHKFLTGTISSTLYRALNPPPTPPSHLTPPSLPPSSSTPQARQRHYFRPLGPQCLTY